MKSEAGPSVRRVLLAFTAIYLIWGSTFLAIRVAIETIPPFLMAGLRFLSAGLVLYTWARIRGARTPVLREWKSAAVIGIALLLVSNGGVTWSETRVASGVAALLVATVPLWISLLEWLRGNARPAAPGLAGLILGLGGVVVLVAPQLFSPGLSIDPTGIAVLLVACFSWASGSLYSRTAKLPASQIMSAAAQMIAGATALLVAGALMGETRDFRILSISGRSWVALGYLSIFGSIIGFTAYAWLIRTVAPSRVATYAYVNPIIAILLGWSVGGEKLGTPVFVSAAMILVSVVLTVSSRSASKPAPADRTKEPQDSRARIRTTAPSVAAIQARN